MARLASIGARWEPRIRSILRLVAALLFMQHGLNKLLDFPATASHHPYVLFSLVPGLAGLIETFCGFLVAIGLYTRIAAFIMSGEMAFAYFMAHYPRDFFPLLNGGERAVLYCFVFFYLFIAGGGTWSADRWVRRVAA